MANFAPRKMMGIESQGMIMRPNQSRRNPHGDLPVGRSENRAHR